jgi:hypothetical protein
MLQVLKSISFAIGILIFTSRLCAQDISGYLPEKISPSETYLFYLHGGIVQEQGVNAVSERFGPYEYLKILDTLGSYGFRVISERRPKGTIEIGYARKVSLQIDSLLKSGVSPGKIVIVGASLGAYVTTEIAYMMKNKNIKYVVLGFCNEYNIKTYSKYKHKLCGNFLSIYESSDQKKSCDRLLSEKTCKSGYREVQLNMGIDHGFLYKPYPEWVHPLVKWIREN